jgi:type IX secretion system PorP/SprF family membrane protein
MRKIIVFLAVLIFSLPLLSQQIPQFSQRAIDIFSFNPAFAGSKGYSELFIHHRAQWRGFEGAPVTQNFTYQGLFSKSIGIGISALKDEIGPLSTTGIKLAYAHHIDLNALHLSFGISADIYQYGINGNKITIHQEDDPAVLLELSEKYWRPDATFGTFLYNHRFYFGFSILQLLGSTVELYKNEGNTGTLPLVRHYYIHSGFNFSLFNNFDFEPSLLWSKAKGSPMQLELNLYTQYLQKIMLGGSYRLNDAMSVVVGFKIRERFKIAYSYDIVVSPLRTYQSGSHEMILAFIIPNKLGKWNRWRHEYQYDFDPKTHKWKQRW